MGSSGPKSFERNQSGTVRRKMVNSTSKHFERTEQSVFDLARFPSHAISWIQANTGAYRSSPIHPLMETIEIPDLEDGAWFIHFLVPRDAFSVLGRISRGAYPAIQRYTWFGIGLASVIIFLKNSDDITCLSEDSETELISHEVWDIERGVLIRRRLLREPRPIETGEALVLPRLDGSFPTDLTGIVEEFGASFFDAYRVCGSHTGH